MPTVDLDAYLMAQNAPVTTTRSEGGFDFDTNSDRGEIRSVHIKNLAVDNAKIANASITSAKIADFSFNQGSGGTITLGGTSNGNGLMQVLNAAGGTVVTVNNQGISVTGGSITVVNSAGSTILDPTGLVSVANFPNDVYEGSSQLTSSGTGWLDVAGGSFTISLARTTNVLISFSCVMSYAGTNNLLHGAETTIAINGTTQANYPPGSYFQIASGAADFVKYDTTSYSKIYSLATGSNTIKLQWHSISSELAYMFNRTLNYVVLGK